MVKTIIAAALAAVTLAGAASAGELRFVNWTNATLTINNGFDHTVFLSQGNQVSYYGNEISGLYHDTEFFIQGPQFEDKYSIYIPSDDKVTVVHLNNDGLYKFYSYDEYRGEEFIQDNRHGAEIKIR